MADGLGGLAAPLRFPSRLRARLVAGPDRFVVTGAGGWFGRATLELLDEALGDESTNRVLAYGSAARLQKLRSGRAVAVEPLDALSRIEGTGAPLHLAHYAFLTREKTAGMAHDEYVSANRRITALVVEHARRLQMAGAFDTSSGAIYDPAGRARAALADNPYGALKLEEEVAFRSLADAGTRVASCRVFNVAGPFINKDYALSSFLRAALAGDAIRIAATRPVIRSYLHVRDIVAVGFAVMRGLAEPPVAPYDTAGDEAVEMGELARRIRAAVRRPDLPISRPPVTAEPADRYVGDPGVLNGLAAQGGIALAPLDEQIRDTADEMRSRM